MRSARFPKGLIGLAVVLSLSVVASAPLRAAAQCSASGQQLAALASQLFDDGQDGTIEGDDCPSDANGDGSISAADLTQTQADAVFLGERLQPVLDALIVSLRAHQLMRQNLWLAVVYNAIAVPIAIGGYVTPLIAAVAMSGSSILVTLNALRARGGDTSRRDATPSSAMALDLRAEPS